MNLAKTRISVLTPSQKGIYFDCVNNPGTTMYNNPFSMHLPDEIDLDLFKNSVIKTFLCHPALFVKIGFDGENPVMISGNPEVKIEEKSYSSFAKAEKEFLKPFDYENGPLFRAEICKTNEGNEFLFDVHHLVFDGFSLRTVMTQIESAYKGDEVFDETVTMFDYADNCGKINEDDYKKGEEFFRNRLTLGENESEIIPDVDSNLVVGGTNNVYLSGDEFICKESTEKFCKETGISEATLFAAAYAVALSVYTGSNQSNFTTVTAGRHGENLPDTVGMFVKTLPIHCEIPKQGSVIDFLKDFKAMYYGTLKSSVVPYSALVTEYGLNLRYSFAYQGFLVSDINLEGKTVSYNILPVDDCQSDMLCMIHKTSESYEIENQCPKKVFSEGMLLQFSKTILKIAGEFICKSNLEDIDFASNDNRKFIDEINSTEREYDESETIGSVFERIAKENSDKNALVYKDKSYTYSKFDRITKNLASYISSLNLGKDDFVAVLSPRNDLTVISAWGIIRSGAAYQPLDPSYPAERLEYMVKDSKTKLLIADRNLIELIPDFDGKVLFTDEISALDNCDELLCKDYLDGAISLIYTSGTTGKPKGCILENRNLVAFFYNHTSVMKIDNTSRVASYASFGFDAGVMDIITTIMAGACLYIIPDEIRLDLNEVEKFYCDNEINSGFMTTQVGRMFAQETKCKSIRTFTVGGEKLVPFTPQKSFPFINGYGPCETMAYICSYEVKDNSSVQPIGKPSGNTKLYVTDSLGRLLPVGATGELCIAGKQVGRGYLGLPEKTNEVFVKNPFTDKKGYERIYKTGDIVRLLPDGNLEYIGRRDGQVKIRGFRIELTEVEEVIRRFDGVKDATVAAFDDPSGGKFIAAYVVGDEIIDISSLNDFILGEKPPYMVPAVTMQIDAIPYNQNQKVNKRALPKPEKTANNGEIIPPETDNQRKILDIASEILGSNEIGITTDLFDAGLTSISTLRFNVAIGKLFGKNISISDIKENRTVKLLDELLSGKSENNSYEKQADYPIMKNQMGVFIDSVSDKDTLRYNIPALFKISDKIDTLKLKEAIISAVDAHSYIKSTLSETKEGDIRLVRNDEMKTEVEIINCQKLPESLSLIRPFEMVGGKLYRAEIYVTNEGNYLFIDVHHILSDGTSLGILLEEINRCYEGKNPQGESFNGFDASLREEEISKGENYIKAQNYFENLLSGCNTDCLPAPCPENDSNGIESAHFIGNLDKCSDEIIAYCNKNGFTLNAFFNAVFSHILSLYLHNDDVTYCTVYNGRGNSDYASCFAMLVKTLPVRTFVDYKSDIASFISDMQTQLLETMSNDIVPFSEIGNKYSIKPDIFFNYQGDNFSFDNIGGEKAEAITPALPDVKAPISIEVFLKDGIFTLDINYSSAVFCKDFASSLAESIATAAKGFTNKKKLCEVSLVSDKEIAHFDEMNDTDKPFEKVPAHSFITKNAQENPNKIAVVSRNGSLTFDALEKKSNAVANALIALGVGKDEIVGLLLDRDEFIPIGEIGIMKSGGAFLPMLPTYPDDRIGFCLNDANCRFVISTKDIIESKPELFDESKSYKALSLEDLTAYENTDLPNIEYDMSALVYCIYTSGSTGTPKGVMLEQHNLTNFVQTSLIGEVEKVGSTILCMASISFDMSVTEIFFSLCCGNTIYIAAEEEIHNLDLLLSAFKSNNIDMMIMTPSFAWSLLSLPDFEAALGNLKSAVLGAEAFQPSLYNKLKSLNPDMLIQNGYGPTECTQACSVKTVTSDSEITIGGPFPNTKFYVMDDNGNLLPRYAVGELIICGECVCRGYVKQPEKNKASFFDINGVRAYHSGDLIRINRDNEAQFGGRKDNQVKLRGFRVELDEVEAVMEEFEGITRSKVIVRNNGTEDFLAGFFTADKQIDIDELTSFMKSKLTYYMVPAAMMQIDKMPLTPNGKLDKKALPEIKAVKKERKARKPKKSLEEKILDVFKAVLGNDDCYVDDNFFEIGGTSLSASKAVMQIKAEGYKVEYQDIFDYQSAEELAEYLESLGKSDSNSDDENAEKTNSEEEFADVLKFNTIDYANEVERKSLGTVVLTGPTGFLGSHILKELIDNEDGNIICIARKGSYDDVITRLQSSLVYYFEDDFKDEFKSRISVIEGDITDEALSEKFKGIHFDTLINCAACVKHYANDNSIEFVNVFGVENLIALTKEKGARMIQISTTSIPGTHTEETYKLNLKMTENRLFVVEDNNNQYIQSKYKAEQKMFEAIREGMSGKVIRVGNLMGRYSDGEFQTNNRTNAFINGLRGFVNIGKCPISHSTDPMGFSPIDCTAKAVVLLAGTNDKFTAFHADSRYAFDEMKLIEAVNNCGLKVTPVPDEEYYADFYRMMADPVMNEKVSALLTNDRPDLHVVETDNRFTANVLYRLGFSWPFIDTAYLERVIKSLDSLDFFFMER